MNKPEQQFWQLIKDHLPGDVSRIENTADSGTPDVTGAWLGNDYWIELKVSTNKDKILHPEKICRPSQIVWHARRGKHGSRIIVVTRYPEYIVLHSFINKEYHWYVTIFKTKNKWDWCLFENHIKILIQRRSE